MVETTITIFDELGVDNDYQVFEKIAYGAKTSYKVIEKAIVLFKRLDLAEEYKKYGISE